MIKTIVKKYALFMYVKTDNETSLIRFGDLVTGKLMGFYENEEEAMESAKRMISIREFDFPIEIDQDYFSILPIYTRE